MPYIIMSFTTNADIELFERNQNGQRDRSASATNWHMTNARGFGNTHNLLSVNFHPLFKHLMRWILPEWSRRKTVKCNILLPAVNLNVILSSRTFSVIIFVPMDVLYEQYLICRRWKTVVQRDRGRYQPWHKKNLFLKRFTYILGQFVGWLTTFSFRMRRLFKKTC